MAGTNAGAAVPGSEGIETLSIWQHWHSVIKIHVSEGHSAKTSPLAESGLKIKLE